MPARVPLWIQILDITDGDPLRAMELEEKVTERWWGYAQYYRQERARADKEAAKGLKK